MTEWPARNIRVLTMLPMPVARHADLLQSALLSSIITYL